MKEALMRVYVPPVIIEKMASKGLISTQRTGGRDAIPHGHGYMDRTGTLSRKE